MTVVIRGDALHLPLADKSVDLVVTSPPYFSQRSYRDDGEHYDGQVGSEATPREFLESLWTITAECWRVLKDSGSMFVNLGDKRSGSSAPGTTSGLAGGAVQGKRSGMAMYGHDRASEFGRAKSKMLLPHRYAIGCEDGLADPQGIGWIVRQDLVWEKPNGLPESVRDRTRDNTEFWFHMTKQGAYYSALDEIREDHADSPGNRYPRRVIGSDKARREGGTEGLAGTTNSITKDYQADLALGKMPGSVWKISTEPLVVPDWVGVDHFAAFPIEWPRRLILGWSPSGICTRCGTGRFPVTEKDTIGRQRAEYETTRGERGLPGDVNGNREHFSEGVVASIVGYACACTPRTHHRGERGDWRDGREESADHGTEDGWSTPGAAVPRRPGGFGTKVPAPSVREWEYHLDGYTPAPTRPAVVLDPFGGTGTTAMVARALGRTGISVDLSADYCRLARWRIFDSGHGAKAIGRTMRERQGKLL